MAPLLACENHLQLPVVLDGSWYSGVGYIVHSLYLSPKSKLSPRGIIHLHRFLGIPGNCREVLCHYWPKSLLSISLLRGPEDSSFPMTQFRTGLFYTAMEQDFLHIVNVSAISVIMKQNVQT